MNISAISQLQAIQAVQQQLTKTQNSQPVSAESLTDAAAVLTGAQSGSVQSTDFSQLLQNAVAELSGQGTAAASSSVSAATASAADTAAAQTVNQTTDAMALYQSFLNSTEGRQDLTTLVDHLMEGMALTSSSQSDT